MRRVGGRGETAQGAGRSPPVRSLAPQVPMDLEEPRRRPLRGVLILLDVEQGPDLWGHRPGEPVAVRLADGEPPTTITLGTNVVAAADASSCPCRPDRM